MQQGTVKSFDPASQETVVLTDDRVEYVVPRETFRKSRLRHLTLGQRVKFMVEDDRVTYVNILTLPDPD
jgi:cold shock CspA family protein